MSATDDDTGARLSKLLDVIENGADVGGQPVSMLADEPMVSSLVLFALSVVAGFVLTYSLGDWLFQ